MLNEKELLAFISRLLTLACGLGLSDRSMAALLGVSPKTMNRWLSAARAVKNQTGRPAHSVYHHVAGEISNKVNYLMANIDPVKFQTIPSRAERLRSLKDMLAKRSV